MDKLPQKEGSQTSNATLDIPNNSDSNHKARKKPFDETMSPEFRKKYLENIIKFVDDRIKESQQNLAASEKYLKEAREAADNLTQKIAMINKLRRKPSEKSLKQIEFLKDYIPKFLDKKTKDYDRRKLELTIALDFNKDELKEFQEELNSLNSKPNKL